MGSKNTSSCLRERLLSWVLVLLLLLRLLLLLQLPPLPRPDFQFKYHIYSLSSYLITVMLLP